LKAGGAAFINYQLNKIMTRKLAGLLIAILTAYASFAQVAQKEITIKRIKAVIKIDGIMNEEIWKDAPAATGFTELRPTPFKAEDAGNSTKIYFLYNNEGIYVGGYCYERSKDSIASELVGRDGFGNNDFIGIIFDTYYDKLNGFEYFTTPLGEQFDAKVAPNNNGDNEDFSWNAVWQSAAKVQSDGWSFEMFLPYSAIRFGKKKVQNWGLNIVRRRQKSGQQLFWKAIDPNVNGFLTQEGLINNLEDIKPPMRLQFSPYFSMYQNHDDNAAPGAAKNTSTINGGMDVKYGLNQAFTLDMTLIPDFGQVQSDNRVLNLSPFEQRFSENRTFFTEGTELFNKGNLFYSRRIGRIGGNPLRYRDVGSQLGANEFTAKNPEQVKLINATKISGRTQKGLGVGILNAITNTQNAVIENSVTKQTRKFETEPLTNYNILVLDQTMKNNSSISFVNTNVMRSGKDYDANVSSLLFDLNDKKNTWNLGGNVGMSAIINQAGKNTIGYTHNIYFGKTSGRFNFNVWQELTNNKYDKSDLGYFTNNNTMDQGVWMGYNWNKPRGWYNSMRINFNGFYSRLVSPLDAVKGKDRMYQNAGINTNLNIQTKKLWSIGMNINGGPSNNDFYEPRVQGRVFSNKGRIGTYMYWNSNEAKKLSWGGNLFAGTGGVFKRKAFDLGLYGKIRFSSKFSVDISVNTENAVDGAGWADVLYASAPSQKDTVIFSRRDLRSVENTMNVKYNFTNRMGLTLRTRHYWSKVTPSQFYELNTEGDLVAPSGAYTKNRNQNYNYFTVDMVYTWQFAQGSFINVVWKDIGENFSRTFEKDYFKNATNTISGDQFTSLSLRVIYFLDYLTFKNRIKKKPAA
jgi:hypothetical protein